MKKVVKQISDLEKAQQLLKSHEEVMIAECEAILKEAFDKIAQKGYRPSIIGKFEDGAVETYMAFKKI